ncbi:STM4015 family protein [Nocardiopsis sp. CT-R113]|uniref:STM4015 family protein n=1 Tax=Nocardiopsis codii TaxID=3065942 RepID=A0ABU7K2Y4_9ACTN|nr:STM4015 family protein [Nocardiopsis sp. CT-R113]MEE2036535.1 STM4015 family protein [Nocardiopsis sp. CT-R113]
MPNSAHLTEYADLPVIEFPPSEAGDPAPYHPLPSSEELAAAVAAPESAAWRLRIDQFEAPRDFPAYFARFVAEVDTSRVRALVIGMWGDGYDTPPTVPRDLLIAHAEAFPSLRALFFGDIVYEENEISWIQQSDLSPLAGAFPALEELTVRGTGDHAVGDSVLDLHLPEHTGLRTLTVQSGGLPGRVSRGIASSGLPALENLELWLGVDTYGGDTAPRDLAPVLSGEAFPALRYLGLRNAEGVDDWIAVLAEAPVTASLDVLDLSLGTLTDAGGRALVDAADAFRHLRRLDLHHHYLSEETAERVRAALPGVGVDLSDVQTPRSHDGEAYYYTAVAE